MTGFWQDVRHGGFLLRKHLGFTAAATLTLALAIGAMPVQVIRTFLFTV